jgi:hypothetical protein
MSDRDGTDELAEHEMGVSLINGDAGEGAASSRASRRSRALARLISGWVLLGGILVCVALVRCRSVYDASDFHGVRLGFAARDVRDRFPLRGAWQASSDELSWTPSDGVQTVREVHFEFHMGSLVAVRARLSPRDESARGGPLQTTAATLVARTPRSDGDVDLFLVARDCPTHAAEVARLLGSAKGASK